MDGEKAYAGKTKQNLGYYTVRFDPVRGESVTMQMIGTGQDRGAIGYQ